MSMQPAFYGAETTALQKWFQAVDRDHSGRISCQELQRALQMGNLNFSLKLVSSSSGYPREFQQHARLHRVHLRTTYLQSLQQTFVTCDRSRRGSSTCRRYRMPFGGWDSISTCSPRVPSTSLCSASPHSGREHRPRFIHCDVHPAAQCAEGVQSFRSAAHGPRAARLQSVRLVDRTAVTHHCHRAHSHTAQGVVCCGP